MIKFNHISPTVYSRFTYILCHSMSPQVDRAGACTLDPCRWRLSSYTRPSGPMSPQLQNKAGAAAPPRRSSIEFFHEGSGAVCARMGFVPIPLLYDARARTLERHPKRLLCSATHMLRATRLDLGSCLVVGIVGRDVYPSLDMRHPSGWVLVGLLWLTCCALKVLTSMTLLGYACRRVEHCPAEESDEGTRFLQGVERFTSHKGG